MTVSSIVSSLDSVRARRRLLPFVEQTHSDYLAGEVHKTICSELEAFSAAVVAKQSPRLLISMPPRHGKSVLAGERLPVWHLGKHPSHEVVIGSYALGPARDRVRESREIAQSPEVSRIFPGLKLARDTRSKIDWRTTEGGGCYAVGVAGSLTSKGADILIIDDPHKDWAESYSALKRESVWSWYRSTAYTRLAPGGGILGIWTRWHEDDLAGRIKEQAAGEGFRVLNFPAINASGDALHPARYPLKRLLKIKEAVGSRVWEALYQGQPTTPGGSVWQRHWWRHWTDAPTAAQLAAGWRARPQTFERIVASWDLTFGSKSSSASWVVGHAWGLAGDGFYLLEEVRGRWGFVESARQVAAMSTRWPDAITIIEDKANGPAVLDHLRGVVPALYPIKPDGSKVVRAHAAAPLVEAGRVFLPDPALVPWVAPYLDEVSAFPEGANDDRVDTDSQALRFLSRRPSFSRRRRATS